jgi:hypothetical protein
MLARILGHLRAQWMGALALFLVLAGGVAYGANTVFSSDIVDGEVRTADIGNQQVRSADVRDDSLTGGGLTGTDIADQSGVDTCTHGTARFGELCVVGADQEQVWTAAVDTCRDMGLRVPTLGEAVALAEDYDVPSVDFGDRFWTDENIYLNGFLIYEVSEDANYGPSADESTWDTVCVTTPTN